MKCYYVVDSSFDLGSPVVHCTVRTVARHHLHIKDGANSILPILCSLYSSYTLSAILWLSGVQAPVRKVPLR